MGNPRPTNPLAKAIQIAEKGNADLGDITRLLGTLDAPDGAIMTAYRRAIAAIRAALDAQTGAVYDQQPILDALDLLAYLVRNAARDALRTGRAIGQAQATAQLRAYGIDVPDLGVLALTDPLRAVTGVVEQQRAGVLALLAAGAEAALIIGDASRQGILRPAPVIQTADTWTARTAAQTFREYVGRAPLAQGGQPGVTWNRQAVAALDARTTDCCLRVHGQIVGMDEPFTLVGTPRYADQMMDRPFHDYCRTSVALYHVAFDDGLTEAMRTAADDVLAEREAGGTGERRPATAFGGLRP